MDEKFAYVKVAERTLESAEALADNSLQETSAFCSYHAFESLGGAVCSHLGQRYPKGHNKKIGQFIVSSKRVGIAYSVSVLAIVMQSLGRNSLLYPNPLPNGDFEIPEQKLSITNARDLVRKVKGVKRKIDRIIR
jgi:HEPN domain-containing protein